MLSAAIIILLALAFLAVTEALPVLTSTLIIARSSDITIFPFNESSNATSDLSSTSWVDSWQTSAATYFLFIYCSLSLVALVLMVTNRSGTQDLVFRLFDWMSDCFTWPLAPERRTHHVRERRRRPRAFSGPDVRTSEEINRDILRRLREYGMI